MGVNNSKNDKANKDITKINIIYNTKTKEYINLFGDKFIENNKKICKMIIDKKQYEIAARYYIKNNNNLLKIKLKGINKVNDMSYMFYGCSSLLYLPDISEWNINNANNLSYMFFGCTSLLSLPDISEWNTNNVTNISYMFYGCSSLSSLPDISKWNTNNVTDMGCMFKECSSLLSLPDISK